MAGLGAVVDQQDLPGPQGTKQLHLRKKEGPDEEELETVGDKPFGVLLDVLSAVLLAVMLVSKVPCTVTNLVCIQP